ncbi:uncharacterized protein BO97DRAFT_475485 [Aspergillus homomorphus CBS 101889]|uniref:Uncharacterized protein n=1 Tax=Aspergillus homomorphus (strain CBS 101889) TaxID=1450537 RepID=A0A395I7S9_ASPHC|nr:hypothetical protein BO97DRAFT_475485 [Aspergillus homomorphus CBS 101889]RAL15869.1 hypothetical protein BO97DRAFT_475485 [Aspergillus homomorphus CBS 101889]
MSMTQPSIQRPTQVKDASHDGALQLLAASSATTLDCEASYKLVRKIDLYIMPLICIVYFPQYLDKIAISYASVTGLRESAHLHGNQYNWIFSIFFVGQLVFSFPTMFGGYIAHGIVVHIGSTVFKRAQVLEALTDPLTWLRTEQRLFWCIVGHIPSIVGANLMATTRKNPALIGNYLSGGILIGWTTILGLTSTNVAGSTKKITVSCIQTVVYLVGNIISPQTFQAKDAPRYLPPKISIVVLYVLITLDLCLVRWVSLRENKKRDAEKVAEGGVHVVE